jgi:hypothetical protein
MPAKKKMTIIPVERAENLIIFLRDQRVIVDSDLAQLYGVSTKRLNEQIRRNKERFPAEFVFTLTPEEKIEVVANCDHLTKLKFSPNLPYVFTEHGVLMAATVLNSPQAIEASVWIIRAFVKLRQVFATHKELARKLIELEQKYDKQFQSVFAAIRLLMREPEYLKPPIGYLTESSRNRPGSKRSPAGKK